MSHRLSRDAYENLIAGNLEWLAQQPRTLEREHIAMIVKASADHEYGLRELAAKLPNDAELGAAVRALIGGGP